MTDYDVGSPATPTLFVFDSHLVRVIRMDDASWFVAMDPAGILGYRTAEKMTRMLDEDEVRTHLVGTNAGPREVLIISEAGLYHACLKSRRPEAQAFRRWVTHEVIPAIRKTGRYESPAHEPPTAAERDPISPFRWLDAMLLGQLRLIGKPFALAYMASVGVTEELVSPFAGSSYGIPGPGAGNRAGVGAWGEAAPFDYLRERLPRYAKDADDQFWYVTASGWAACCAPHSPLATGRALRDAGFLWAEGRHLARPSPRWLAEGGARRRLYWVRKEFTPNAPIADEAQWSPPAPTRANNPGAPGEAPDEGQKPAGPSATEGEDQP